MQSTYCGQSWSKGQPRVRLDGIRLSSVDWAMPRPARPSSAGQAPPPRPARRHLTMRQIGQIAGVSESTVSRILSGSDFRIPIAASTRERVLKVVAELGYIPNPLARALRGARSALLGLIVREVGDPF